MSTYVEHLQPEYVVCSDGQVDSDLYRTRAEAEAERTRRLAGAIPEIAEHLHVAEIRLLARPTGQQPCIDCDESGRVVTSADGTRTMVCETCGGSSIATVEIPYVEESPVHA